MYSGYCNCRQICNNSNVEGLLWRVLVSLFGPVFSVESGVIRVFVDSVDLRGAGFPGNWRSGRLWRLYCDVQHLPHPCATGCREIGSWGSAGAGGPGLDLSGWAGGCGSFEQPFIEDLMAAVAGACSVAARRSAAAS